MGQEGMQENTDTLKDKYTKSQMLLLTIVGELLIFMSKI
jgi:hypothetical protein